MPADPTPTLPAALRRHAALSPEAPFLFYPQGLDWRWHPFAAVAAAVERLRGELAEKLAAAGVVPGAVVGYRWVARPEIFALDLALQAAGFVAAPLAGELSVPGDGGGTADGRGEGGARTGVDRGLAAFLALQAGEGEGGGGEDGEHGGAAGAISLQLRCDERTLWRATRAKTAAASDPATEVSGGARVTEPEAGRGWPAARWVAEGRALERRLAETLPAVARPRREVLVAARAPAAAAERRLLAWASLHGAALVLEPDPANLVTSAAWVRPSIFQGTAHEAAALLGRAEARDREGWSRLRDRLRRLAGRPPAAGRRLPFGRLHTLLLPSSDDGAPSDLAARAAARGVRLLSAEPRQSPYTRS